MNQLLLPEQRGRQSQVLRHAPAVQLRLLLPVAVWLRAALRVFAPLLRRLMRLMRLRRLRSHRRHLQYLRILAACLRRPAAFAAVAPVVRAASGHLGGWRHQACCSLARQAEGSAAAECSGYRCEGQHARRSKGVVCRKSCQQAYVHERVSCRTCHVKALGVVCCEYAELIVHAQESIVGRNSAIQT